MVKRVVCNKKQTTTDTLQELSDIFAMSHTHPHTPETLLDLLRMGTELETAETRIQKALRACILISLVTALKKEGKRARDQSQSTLSMTTHDSTVDESFSKVEQLLHMHQILPDHPVSIEIEKDNNNTTNSNNTFSGAHHNTTRRGQWRYLPEDDAVALDLQSLVLRGMLDEKLSEAERIKRKVESEAMVTIAELAALREEVVINRKKHIDKMLGNVKLENSSMKQQFIDLQHEKDAIEEREMRLQDHCEAVQEELNNYKGRISRLESKYTLLHKDYKHSLAENRRIKKEMKDSKKAFPNSGTGINRSSAFLKNMKFAESATSLNRGLYSFPSASSTADEKLDNFSERGDIAVNSAKDISILSKQQNGNTDFNARAAAVAGKKNYNAAQKAAELINYPKISSKKNRHGTTKPVQAWRPGGNAKPPRKIKSNKSVLSPPQFDKDAYYNSNSSQSGNSNGRYKLPVQKPWEPKRVVRRNILKSNNNKSIPNGQKSMKSPKQKTPVVAVSLDDSTDDGGKFAAVDIVDINVAWDGDNAIDDANGSDKEIINKHAKIASIDFKEKNVHRSKLDELAQVLETLRSSPTSPNTII